MTTITTAAAAAQAGVTVATIRTWCRKGVVAATKQAGRWVINEDSFNRRITIGKIKARKEGTMPVPGTMSERGQDFVAAWPAAITSRLNLAAEWMADAMLRAGLINDADRNRLAIDFLYSRPTREVASLTPEQAKRAIACLKDIRRELNQTAKTHCRYCGRPLNRAAACDECGDQL